MLIFVLYRSQTIAFLKTIYVFLEIMILLSVSFLKEITLI